MMVNGNSFAYALGHAFGLDERYVAKRSIAGMLPGEPNFSRPESAGPLVIVAGQVESVQARAALASMGKQGKIPAYLSHGMVKCDSGFFVRDRLDAGGGHFRGQPFKPDVAIPCTKNLWSKRNTITTGTRLTTDAAMISPYSEEYWDINIRIPI